MNMVLIEQIAELQESSVKYYLLIDILLILAVYYSWTVNSVSLWNWNINPIMASNIPISEILSKS